MWDNGQEKGAGVREGQGSFGESINNVNVFYVFLLLIFFILKSSNT